MPSSLAYNPQRYGWKPRLFKAPDLNPSGVEFLSQPRSNFPVRTRVGTWLSLVEHSLGVRGVGSSNLPVPTNLQFSLARRSDRTAFCMLVKDLRRPSRSSKAQI